MSVQFTSQLTNISIFQNLFNSLKEKKAQTQTPNNQTFIISSIQYKITRHVKKQDNMIQNKKKNKSIERDLEMTKMMELADDDFKNNYYKCSQGLKGKQT